MRENDKASELLSHKSPVKHVSVKVKLSVTKKTGSLCRWFLFTAVILDTKTRYKVK